MFKKGDIAKFKNRMGDYMVCLVLEDITQEDTSRNPGSFDKWIPLSSSDSSLTKKGWGGPFRSADPPYKHIGNIHVVEKEYPNILDLLKSPDKESVDYALAVIKQFIKVGKTNDV